MQCCCFSELSSTIDCKIFSFINEFPDIIKPLRQINHIMLWRITNTCRIKYTFWKLSNISFFNIFFRNQPSAPFFLHLKLIYWHKVLLYIALLHQAALRLPLLYNTSYTLSIPFHFYFIISRSSYFYYLVLISSHYLLFLFSLL